VGEQQAEHCAQVKSPLSAESNVEATAVARGFRNRNDTPVVTHLNPGISRYRQEQAGNAAACGSPGSADPYARRIVRRPGKPGERWKGTTMPKPSRSARWDRVQQAVALVALVTNEAIKVIGALHGR
jgi:hypothetical protein